MGYSKYIAIKSKAACDFDREEDVVSLSEVEDLLLDISLEIKNLARTLDQNAKYLDLGELYDDMIRFAEEVER